MSNADARKRRNELIEKHVHDIWHVWSAARQYDGKPCCKLRMLCSQRLRDSFVAAIEGTLPLEWDSDLDRDLTIKAALEDLTGLGRGGTIVTDDDLDTLMRLAPHAADVVELARAKAEELAS